MRAGIVILTDQPWAVAAQRWRRAEEYGFAHAWTYDHIGWRDLVDGVWFDAVPTLAAAATVTRRIPLGTFVASPNLRHPVTFARVVTALDDISGGRFVLGVGAGGAGYDETVLGGEPLSPRHRHQRFAEFVELLDEVLREGRATRHGDYYTAVDARATPGCVQQPRVPFVVAANGPRAMALAARYGQGWVTSFRTAADLDGWWRAAGEANERFTAAVERAGRPPDEVARYLSLDSAPVYSLSSAGAFADAVERAEALGFTDVVSHWPRESSWYAGDERVLEEVAARVLPHLSG